MNWLLAVALALLLGGCSMVRLGYSQLPELSYWWLDSYLDLDVAQGSVLKVDLGALHTWHRQQEMVWLTHTLTELESRALQDTTAAALCQTTEAVRQRFDLLSDQSVPMLTRLATSLKPAQLDHLHQQLAKRRQGWQEEWLGADATKRRSNRLVERTEQFYGRLDTAQKTMLMASVTAEPVDEQYMLNDILKRHLDIEQTARKVARGDLAAEDATREVRGLLQRLMHPSDATRSAQRQQNQCKVLSDLHNSATPAQRQKLASTLKAYAGDAQAMTLSLTAPVGFIRP